MRKPKPTLQISPLMQLQNCITARDDRLLGWLYDHGVLTTDQIAKALFTSDDFAQRRMLRLTDLKAVTRFRPNKPDGGSYPYHYVLDQLGYLHVMGQRDLGLPRRDQARKRQQSLIRRPDLPHLLGGNQFFTDLAAYEQTHPGTSLARWWPASAFHSPGAFFRGHGDDPMVGLLGELRIPRPDGHGVWMQAGRAVPFFLEHDTGTERREILAEKIDKYARVYSMTQWHWQILFHLPTAKRETNLHAFMAGYARSLAVPYFTTSAEYLAETGLCPAEQVWWPGGVTTFGRRRLIDLPYHDPEHDTEWNLTNPAGPDLQPDTGQ